MKNSLILEQVSSELVLARFDALEIQLADLKKMLGKIPAPTSEYLSREQTAKKLGISLPTLQNWTNIGLLKGYRIGGKILFKAAEIDRSMVEIPASGKGGRP